MARFRYEFELVGVVESWLLEQGYETRLELQWRPLAATDLVARKGPDFIAVECKLKDWETALAQAVPQGKAFDRVYIAGPSSVMSKQLEVILEDTCPWSNYVGILGVSDEGVTVLREATSIPGWPKPCHHKMVAIQFFSTTRASQRAFRPGRTPATAGARLGVSALRPT